MSAPKSKDRPWFAIAAALYPIAALFAENSGSLALAEVPLPALVAIAVVAGFTALFYRLGPFRAALLGSGLWLFLFVYYPLAGHVGAVSRSPWFTVSAWVAIAVLLLVLLARIPDSAAVRRGVSTAAVVMLLLPVVRIAIAAVNGEVQVTRTLVQHLDRKTPLADGKSADTPDVYHFFLDAYAGLALEDIFGMDNSEFLSALESRGFRIARRAYSNYRYTWLSMGSLLDMRYLDDLSGAATTPDLGPISAVVSSAKVPQRFRNNGYLTIGLRSGFEGSPTVDQLGAATDERSAFAALLLDLTPLAELRPKEQDPVTLHRQQLLTVFQRVADAATIPHPTWTFAHVLAPHPPFVFDENGAEIVPPRTADLLSDESLISENRMTVEEYRARYVGQLKWVNTQILTAVDNILATSKHPPVIILAGDHGARSTQPSVDYDMHTHPRLMHEAFSTLVAVKLPEAKTVEFSDDLSPVNLYRVVFNALFDDGLPLLENRSIFNGWPRYYDFTDVTDVIAKHHTRR